MKKSILTLIVILVALAVQAQRPHTNVVTPLTLEDQIVKELPTEPTSESAMKYRLIGTSNFMPNGPIDTTIYTYISNTSDKVAKEILYKWNHTTLVPSKKVTYVYNSNELKIESISEIWRDGQWQIRNSEIIEYNTENKIANITIKRWNSFGLASGQEDKIGYNDEGEEISRSISKLNTTTLAWELDVKEMCEYEDGLLISQEVNKWEDNTWRDYQVTNYTYNMDKQLVDVTTLTFQRSTMNWTNTKKKIYTYNTSGHLSRYEMQLGYKQSWKNHYLLHQSTDINGNPVQLLSRLWNGDFWANVQQSYAVYNDDGDVEHCTYEVWEHNGWEYQNEINFYYESYGIESNLLRVAGTPINTYPNPAITEIQVDLPKEVVSGKVTANIYRIDGVLVRTVRVSVDDRRLNINDLDTGLYILHIQHENGEIYTSRFMKQ